jgi:tetratricopeptide (TPR) repeat protein
MTASASEEPGGQLACGKYIAQATNGATATVVVQMAAAPPIIEPADIAAAEALLASMPHDTLPEAVGMLPGSVLPWGRNHFFVGRESDLCALARRLKEGGPAAIGQSPAVTGMGGQGKTQLAVEFAFRFGPWFKGGVFWVNCADPAGIQEAIAACGPALYPGDPGFSVRTLPDRVQMVVSAWASLLPRLLVFDNCEDEALLDTWAPKGGGCRLLLTARRASWSPARGITPMPLSALSPVESLALLLRHRPELDSDDLNLAAIAEELGHLPLAVELAGSYLSNYRDDPIGAPDTYLTELRAADVIAHASMMIEDPEVSGRSRTLTGHELNVARTFEVSLRRLRSDVAVDGLARDLLACAAWLAAGEPIPRHLLELCCGASDKAIGPHLFIDALNRLFNLALMERTSTGGGVLHRLVAAFARSRLEQAAGARTAVESIVAREASRLLGLSDPKPLRDWAGHLLAVALGSRRANTESSIRLLNVAGSYCSAMADFETAETMLRYAVDQAETFYGSSNINVALILSNLGNAQFERDAFNAAKASLERSLAISIQELGLNHPLVGRVLGNLGLLQFETGDPSAAEVSQLRALAIKTGTCRSEPIDVGMTFANLGRTQRDLGKFVAAEDSLARSLAILKKACAPDHPEIARSLNILGTVKRMSGDFAAAEAHFQQVLAIQRSKLGFRHPEVARTLANIGNVQCDLGNLAAAEDTLTQALEIKKEVYGPDHSDVARTLSNLGRVQLAIGAVGEARISLNQAVEILSAKLGQRHPDTVVARKRLDEIKEKSNKWE